MGMGCGCKGRVNFSSTGEGFGFSLQLGVRFCAAGRGCGEQVKKTALKTKKMSVL